MRSSQILVLLALIGLQWSPAASAAAVSAEENPQCYYVNEAKGLYFNLNPASERDYTVENPSDRNFNYVLNPCTEITSLPVNENCGSGSLGCQVDTATNSPAYLVANNITSLEYDETTSSLTLYLTGGRYCEGNGNYREATIVFSCGEEMGSPLFVSENLCSYKFSWISSAACPLKKAPGTSDGLSAGSIILIVFFSLVALYLLVGMAYNYKANDARGVEMLPNIDFWRGFPSLLRDGCNFALDKCRGRN